MLVPPYLGPRVRAGRATTHGPRNARIRPSCGGSLEWLVWHPRRTLLGARGRCPCPCAPGCRVALSCAAADSNPIQPPGASSQVPGFQSAPPDRDQRCLVGLRSSRHHHRASNARSEGYDRLPGTAGRDAFGLRTVDTQRQRIWWTCTRQQARKLATLTECPDLLALVHIRPRGWWLRRTLGRR